MKEKYLKCLIVIVVIIIGGLFIYQNINKENKPLPEVKLKEIVNKNKSFAIMIQEKSETDKYQEYSSNTWPGDDYKFKEAKCIDNNGDEIKEAVTYENGKVTLTTNKTVYCTIYFDKSIIGKLREKDTQKYLSTDKQGGMYRYQASFPDSDSSEMTNWICFGTTDNCGTNDDNIDKYMYRIIGITPEGQLYLIKETAIKEDTAAGFRWNSKREISDCLGETCEWPNVDLHKRINGTSNKTSPGGNGDTNLFLGTKNYQSPYDYLTEGTEWYSLIETYKWMYGDINQDILISTLYNGDKMYELETGKVAITRYWPDEGQETCSSDNLCSKKEYIWSKNINAKVSLMYIHDYYYSYYDGSDSSTRGNAESYDKLANSWLHFLKDGYNTLSTEHEWLSTRLGVYSDGAFGVRAWSISPSGEVNAGNTSFDCRNIVRPVFYLNSNIKINDGDGTKTNPYIINIEI